MVEIPRFWDEATGQYYLHTFPKEHPDLNWRNPEVRAEMLDVPRFWMDRGVDGFRVDVAQYVMKDPELRDNPEGTDDGLFTHKSMGAYDDQQHLYDVNHPDVHDVYREFRSVLDEYDDPERIAVGEIHFFCLAAVDRLLRRRRRRVPPAVQLSPARGRLDGPGGRAGGEQPGGSPAGGGVAK